MKQTQKNNMNVTNVDFEVDGIIYHPCRYV